MVNCANVLAHGTCSDNSCRNEHNITVCEPCGRIFQDTNIYRSHVVGKQHCNRVSGVSTFVSCPLCEVNVGDGQRGWSAHAKTKKHISKVKSRGLSTTSVEPQMAVSRGKTTYCNICQAISSTSDWAAHLRGQRHKAKEAYVKYRAVAAESEKDKNGLTIEGEFDFGFVDPKIASTGYRTSVILKTSDMFSPSTLIGIQLASSQGAYSRESAFSITFSGSERKISVMKPLTVTLSLKQTNIGRYEERVEFIFEDTQLKKFIIIRTLKVVVGNQAEHQALMPSAPYVPRVRITRQPMREIIEGIKPPALHAIPYIGGLPKAEIPARLVSTLSGSQATANTVAQVRNIFLPASLDTDTYGRYFKHLLWVEEYKMELDLERYDITNACLTRNNNYYCLAVPGLAEKRPSVLVGDRIFVQKQGTTDGKWFEGHVHFVRQAEVELRFHGSFERFSAGRRFHVRFKLNRVPVRRQHQAMNAVFTEERVLFPLGHHIISASSEPTMRLYNPLIIANAPQLQAVKSIVSQPPGSPPFVVFGPPGTGKTITIVEAIRQVLDNNPQAKILACAPSNSAADLIASRLISKPDRAGLNVDQLFRFYAPSRFKNQVLDELLPHTYNQADGHFSVPPMGRMMGFRVLVTTCVSASVAHGIGLPRGHFTHIFIDEAGQATEPETFVSIRMMADTKTNIVLSGDPKQLGPVISSGVARELGLEISYLERLMDRDAYNLSTWYGRSVVKLVKNFRSHNSILKFPNERFYGNDLQACASPSIINAYLNSSYLPSKKFPIVFHAISGKDDREASSPSFFNADEVLQVKQYVQRLKEDRRYRTTDADIGIIAPYHAQCLKLRASLRGIADGVKVGSVEEFQGQERKVIIISTVRSSKDFLEYDLRRTLGFVANPRRFNVAITRAQALLIVVGDPQVLSLDPLWRSFLNYIHNNRGWAGPAITWDPRVPVDEIGGYDRAVREAAKLDMNELTRRLENGIMAEVKDLVMVEVKDPVMVEVKDPVIAEIEDPVTNTPVLSSDVEIGPLVWGRDISSQLRTLIGSLPHSHLISQHVQARRWRTSYIYARFPNNVEAIRFVNAWARDTPAAYPDVSVVHTRN